MKFLAITLTDDNESSFELVEGENAEEVWVHSSEGVDQILILDIERAGKLARFLEENNIQDYPYLRKMDNMIGSTERWCRENLQRARKENAPQNATHRGEERWHTTQDIISPGTRRYLGLEPQ